MGLTDLCLKMFVTLPISTVQVRPTIHPGTSLGLCKRVHPWQLLWMLHLLINLTARDMSRAP